MRRENVSPNTIATYGTACRFFAEWMLANVNPTDMDAITARRVEGWELSLHERVSAATVHNRHRGLQRCFSWYAAQLDDDATWRNPMARMKPPRMERYAPPEEDRDAISRTDFLAAFDAAVTAERSGSPRKGGTCP